MRDGEFSNLSGAGKPIPGIEEPYRDDWWLKSLLKREQLAVPCPSIEIRVDAQKTLARLPELRSAADVRAELQALNDRIARANRFPVSGPATSMALIDIDGCVSRWRDEHNPPMRDQTPKV